MSKIVWIKKKCQICGKEFDCIKGREGELVTCGKFDCLQQANKRGLLK